MKVGYASICCARILADCSTSVAEFCALDVGVAPREQVTEIRSLSVPIFLEARHCAGRLEVNCRLWRALAATAAIERVSSRPG